jgi:hypothetical protein
LKRHYISAELCPLWAASLTDARLDLDHTIDGARGALATLTTLSIFSLSILFPSCIRCTAEHHRCGVVFRSQAHQRLRPPARAKKLLGLIVWRPLDVDIAASRVPLRIETTPATDGIPRVRNVERRGNWANRSRGRKKTGGEGFDQPARDQGSAAQQATAGGGGAQAHTRRCGGPISVLTSDQFWPRCGRR